MTDDQIAAFVKAFPEHDVPHWNERDRFMFQGWQARQPEIDALIHDNGNMRKAIAEYDKENAALKAEVEQLRNDNQRLQDAINITWQCSPMFDKTFCSQCGGEFGPGDHGYSHCESHEGQRRIR